MTLKGGTETKGGFFWRKGEWEIVTVEGKTGTLPGTGKAEYVRIPVVLVIPLAMVISVVYVIFFPFVGFYMLAKAGAGKLRIALRGAHGPAAEKLAVQASGEKHTR
jgi:hypothetical protein